LEKKSIMASIHENISMALFCDFENVALGVRDAKYEKFDIKPVLERLLLKGSIVVKKAYCDWDRYKTFKAGMHEASFELIEIPHIRMSGKNSADIRLVVDALDLCYTKSHVNTFVIISGDSDFSPLVSKLRENAKQVIGVGVKQSTSDLLIGNCDEFIFYDDLVRESQEARAGQHDAKAAQLAARTLSQTGKDGEKGGREELESRKRKAIETAVETFDALISERGDSGKIWASTLKQAIKRRRPGFNESYYGFRAFGNLLEEAQERGLLELGRDEKSGTYVYRSDSGNAGASAGAGVSEPPAPAEMNEMNEMNAAPAEAASPPPLQAAQAGYAPTSQANSGGTGEHEPPRRRRQGRKPGKRDAEQQTAPVPAPAPLETVTAALHEAEPPTPPAEPLTSADKAADKGAEKAPEKAADKGRKPVTRRRRTSSKKKQDADREMQEVPGIPEESQND
jgi:uncharacterized LabA/DUF88 family protein